MNPKNQQRLKPLTGFVFTAIAVVGLSFLSGAGREYGSARVTQMIESMSQEDRDQLRRNYLVFRGLPEHRKREYRRLQENLEQTPERFEVVKNYHNWLNTIPPSEARDLLRITNTGERMARIRELIQTHDPDNSPSHGSQLFATFFATKAERIISTSPRFSPTQMEAVIGVLRQQAELPVRIRREFESLPTAEQHLQVVLSTYRSQNKKPKVRSEPILENEQITRFLAGVEFPKDDPLNFDETDTPAGRRQLFHQVLFATLADELEQELANRMPAADVLEEFQKKVAEKPELQKRLTEIQNSDPQRRLGLLYIQTNDIRFDRSFGQFVTLMKRTLENRNNRPSGKRNTPAVKPESQSRNASKSKAGRSKANQDRPGK